MKNMLKNLKCLFAIIAFLILSINIYHNYVGTKTVIYASRVIEPLEKCVNEATIVAEVEMCGVILENNSEDFPQSLHAAKVINVYKGNPKTDIKILQDGTSKKVFQDLPFFKKGEKYIFTLKPSEDNSIEDLYWITKIYYVDGEQAIDLFSSNELQNVSSIYSRSYSQSNYNEGIFNKINELGHSAYIIAKNNLIDMIEEETK